jgi:hypothetical protein
MKGNLSVSLLLSLGMMGLTGSASAARSVDDQVKILMRRYEQVEGQLDRSVRYSKKEVSGDGTTMEQAWFSGAGDPIKVATERTAPGRRELTEYFALDFDLVHDGMFVRNLTARPRWTNRGSASAAMES